MNTSDIQEQPPGFSLVLGGPLYRFWRWAQLSGSEMELLTRRVLVITALVWLPLLLLSLYEGTASRGLIKIPFSLDVAVQARFLVALPILLIADLIIHQRIGPRIQNFLTRNIITGEEIPKFRSAIDSARRMQNSAWLEIGLIILVYTVGVLSWRRQMAYAAPSWHANPDGTNLNLTLAGYWLAFVSVPIFQFILVRWYARFLIWFWFLWRVSRLKLNLTPTHPDRAGGIGFLGKATYSFGTILFVQGVLLSGFIANLVLHSGRNLLEFRVQAAIYIIFFIAAVFAPLVVFVPPLLNAKRGGLSAYGLLASRYTEGFAKKWIQGVNPEGDELLGSADIQSLADLGNSYSLVRAMRITPFGLQDMLLLAVVTAAPLLPLLLFVFSLEELVDKLLQVIL